MDPEQNTPNSPTTAPNTSPTLLPWLVFLQRMFSDDGEPSSSRLLTLLMAIGCFYLLMFVIRHILGVRDNASLGLWLTAVPPMILAFIALINAPYLINRGGSTLSDIANLIKRDGTGR